MERTTSSTEQTDHRTVTHCLQCNTPIDHRHAFCCSGCETAYHATHAADIADDNNAVSALATQEDTGLYTLTLSVEGIHCASCIQLIENALYADNHVTSARVNMSTKRLTFSWEGTRKHGDILAAVVTKLGYRVTAFDTSQHDHDDIQEQRFLLRCIAVAGFAAGNLMLISVGLWTTTPEIMGMATRDLFHWLSALIALPTIFYSGRPFFYSALQVLKERHTNMDVPISLAVILASAMSISETLQHGEHIYFDSALMLLFFLLIGRYLEARTKGKARESATHLLSMLHGTATILENGKSVTIPIRDLREGMVVSIAAGENIPTDGIVCDGTSELDMSLITGETVPHTVQKGDEVFAGTINLSSPIHMHVSKASDNSLLSDIIKLMENAEQGQARYVRLADKAAQLYTPVVHSMGLLTFLGWWLLMGHAWQPSLLNAITVLIITCPCALGLAVPVAQVIASSLLMKQGILLKSGDALEKLATITIAVFDKTGTLTIGKPELLEGNYSPKDLQLAASLASYSKHPLSKALCKAYTGSLLPIEQVEELPGKGLKATYNKTEIQLGKRDWCGDTKAPQHNVLELWLSQEGKTPIHFTFSDIVREDARKVITLLQERAIKTVLLSGDRKETVEHIAQTVGITDYYALLSPIEKCEYLETLKTQGHKILMVGDGLNDAPSLATADISISPSTAMDITQNTADIVFQGDKLMPVFTAWNTGCRTTSLVKQNFLLAVIYNIIAIPIAVMGYVTPLIAAIAMSGSSLVVIGNSFRLHSKRQS